MKAVYVVIAIVISAACTLAVRALPFVLMGGDKKIPDSVRYLGKILPSAIMAVLIVYCLRTVPTELSAQSLCQLIAVGVCAAVHIWKRNSLLSILVSTGLYMVLCAIL